MLSVARTEPFAIPSAVNWSIEWDPMSEFTLETDSISIGDPAMGLARYSVSLAPGRYTLDAGALKPVDEADAIEGSVPRIDLDGPYLYVLDTSKTEQFEAAFHQLGNECSYNLMVMQSRHEELESKVGSQIGFYWEADVAGTNREGTYMLDIAKVRCVS